MENTQVCQFYYHQSTTSIGIMACRNQKLKQTRSSGLAKLRHKMSHNCWKKNGNTISESDEYVCLMKYRLLLSCYRFGYFTPTLLFNSVWQASIELRINFNTDTLNTQLKANASSSDADQSSRYSPVSACHEGSRRLYSADEQARTIFITMGGLLRCRNRSTTGSAMATRSFFNSKELRPIARNAHEWLAI